MLTKRLAQGGMEQVGRRMVKCHGLTTLMINPRIHFHVRCELTIDHGANVQVVATFLAGVGNLERPPSQVSRPTSPT